MLSKDGGSSGGGGKLAVKGGRTDVTYSKTNTDLGTRLSLWAHLFLKPGEETMEEKNEDKIKINILPRNHKSMNRVLRK